MTIIAFVLSLSLWAADPAEFEAIGYSPDLNTVFGRKFTSPDDGKCVSYIVDLTGKTKYVLPSRPDHKPLVIGLGEDDETSSCALRAAFDAQLGIKLKTDKDLSAQERALVGDLLKSDWSADSKTFKVMKIGSLGDFLRKQRAAFKPDGPTKLLELALTEIEDGGSLEAFDALILAQDWKPGITSPAGKKWAAKLVKSAEPLLKAQDTKDNAKGLVQYELAARLDPKQSKAVLALAAQAALREDYDSAARRILQALKNDAVLTTRLYREGAEFKTLRCEPKAARARKALPEDLTKDASCA